MVRHSLDEACSAVTVDLQPWIHKASFRTVFAWHNNLLVEVCGLTPIGSLLTIELDEVRRVCLC